MVSPTLKDEIGINLGTERADVFNLNNQVLGVCGAYLVEKSDWKYSLRLRNQVQSGSIISESPADQ